MIGSTEASYAENPLNDGADDKRGSDGIVELRRQETLLKTGALLEQARKSYARRASGRD